MKVLVTGGAGYIGSTVVSACLDAGHIPIVVDDLSSGRPEFARICAFYHGDVADTALLRQVVADHPELSAVVHCAARIVVPESVSDPLGYYETNVGKTIDLLHFMLAKTAIWRFVFSSSAAIYAGVDPVVTESSPLEPQSPYARTKLMVEQVLQDTAAATDLRVLSLRYFNPVGADPQLRSGQYLERPTHVLGQLLLAHSSGKPFTITGTNWPTRDGTAIRDFIHVWDLARAHVAALDRFETGELDTPFEVVNLGTGRGTTIRELVDLFQRVAGSDFEVREGPQRPGDVVGSYAGVDKAADFLGWRAGLSTEDAVQDSLRWLQRRRTVLGF